jgi:alpha-glucosidase
MTVEGVRGNEHMPTARHNTTLPFTRAVAGSYDYTICWSTPRLKTTRAHQMAQSVVHYSPWQFLYWYDKPSDVKEEPALEFFKGLPTVWDETRVLAGEIGEFAVVARRKGGEWRIGAITNEQGRRVSTELKALAGKQATVYCDGASATDVKVSETTLDASGRLVFEMAASGGCAAVIK